MGVSKEEFRSALGRFASGVTVVTARGRDNELLGITVSAFSSVSLEPPLVLVCIDKRSSLHGHLTEGKSFVVNILGQDQEMMSRRFASKDENRFNGTAYRDSADGVPILDGTLASLKCHVVHSYPGGDHTIIVGEVESTVIADGKPLAYFRGGYVQLS
jgi:flavin reductase (DIM6/NTAB) family NADH-FMN oxidoreductase RutF